ncbi:polysaccharide biosynthesis/export family protein [Methylobacterium sp. JK268]
MKRLITAIWLSAALVAPARLRAEEYRLQVGDTLELSVAGLALQRRMTIDVDGRISLPLVGEVEAGGRTVSELADYVRREMPTKYLNVRTAEGKDQMTVIEGQEISIYVAEYVPVYVNGDVSRPGDQRFRPGMTVRQAISLAGGIDVMRFRVDNPGLVTMDFEDELRTKWMDWERFRTRQSFFLRALNRPAAAGPAFALKSPLPQAARDQIARIETDQLRAGVDKFDQERAGIEQKIALLDGGIKTLADLKKTDDENLKLDSSEASRINDLFSKGTLPANRVADARRLVLLSATSSLQVGVQLENARRDRANAKADLDKLINERNEKLLADLQDATDSLAKAQSRIDALTQKMVYTSALRSQLLGSGISTPRVKIVRRVTGAPQVTAADLDAILSPGDVVEVRLDIMPTGRTAEN